jgi:6-phosphogluconolactonase
VRLEIVETPLLPRHAAARIATLLTEAVDARGHASLAVSGGSTPAAMLGDLSEHPVPWAQVHLFQVDERIAPDGASERNLGDLSRELVDALEVAPAGVHPMPVARLVDAPASARSAAEGYARTLRRVAGDPPLLDVVHLGLGDDGHTASLVPDDPVLTIEDREVAVTGPYRGHRRMTLTFPALARARHLVWLVAGTDKAAAVRRLVDRDPTIPAGRVPQRRAVLMLDPGAAASLR